VFGFFLQTTWGDSFQLDPCAASNGIVWTPPHFLPETGNTTRHYCRGIYVASAPTGQAHGRWEPLPSAQSTQPACSFTRHPGSWLAFTIPCSPVGSNPSCCCNKHATLSTPLPPTAHPYCVKGIPLCVDSIHQRVCHGSSAGYPMP
jgi:hypothetical protein